MPLVVEIKTEDRATRRTSEVTPTAGSAIRMRGIYLKPPFLQMPWFAVHESNIHDTSSYTALGSLR